MVARRQPLEPRPVELNDLVTGLVRLLERLMKGIELRLDLEAEAGTVLADPGQLEQVVLNLVLNARDACQGRGRVTVATRRITRAEGEGGRAGGEWARLSVQDDGPGLAPATRARVFEPFFTTKAEGQGTGLGLSVVDGVARAHGGFVEVISAPGQGATFAVWLPASGAARQDGWPALTPPPGGALTGTVRSVT
jgi:signal transduction histidine kinase